LQFRGPGDAKERDLSWLDYATLRDMSPDGAQIVFDDWGSAAGTSDLAYVRKTDGSPAVKLGAWNSPVLSPDGSRVFTWEATQASQGQHLVLLPTGVGEIQALSYVGFQQYSSAGWMPDGKAVYFAADDGHGWRMYVQDITGTPRAVTPTISVKPTHFESHLVSPDGKFVFARDLSGKAGLYPIAGGEFQRLPGWLPEDIWITWSGDGRSAYVYHDEKTSGPVYRLDVASGKRQLVTTLAPGDPAGVTSILNVRMTPDGKSSGYSYFREASDLFLVEGVR